MKRYYVSGVYTTRRYATRAAAWAVYCRGSVRRGYPDPWHIIGDVCGDWQRRESDGTITRGGVRDGHAEVTIYEV